MTSIYPRIDSPWLWLLLIVPVTIAMVGYKNAERASNRLPGADPVTASGTYQQASPEPPAVPLPGTVDIRATAAQAENTAMIQEPVVEAPVTLHPVADDDVFVESSHIRPVEPVQQLAEDGTAATAAIPDDTLPDTPLLMAHELPETVSGGSILTTATAGSATDSVMNDNPYLPVASEEGYDDLAAYSAPTPACPSELYRGGSDYARFRLALMGCPTPDG